MWDVDIINALSGELLLYEQPFIIIRDFNAHVFGTKYARGRHLVDFMRRHGLLILNDGTPTYYHAGASTTIDLALVSDLLFPILQFTLGDLAPESLHRSIHLIFDSGGIVGKEGEGFGALRHRKPPSPPPNRKIDIVMKTLLDTATINQKKSAEVSVSNLLKCSSMSRIRRRLRCIGKKPLPLDETTILELANLKQDWRLLSNKKLKIRRKQIQQEMWEVRGCKGYWNHINNLRHKKTGIALKPRHVEKHFRGLLDVPLEGCGDPMKLGIPLSFFQHLSIPAREPLPLSAAETADLYTADQDYAVLNDIPDAELLSHYITPAEVAFALSKLKNSAKGEDNISVTDLKTIHCRDISQFFMEVVDSYEVPSI